MFESSQLMIISTLAKASSLSEVGEILGITQSAVSQNIKSLEQKVGFSLVARQGKKMVLTPGGLRLAKLSGQYFKKMDELISDVQESENKVSGSLSIGTLFGLGKSWVASTMIEFAKAYPDLNIKVSMDFPETLLKGFENHDFDCLILPENLTPAYCESELLHQEKARLVFSKKFADKIHNKMSVKDMAALPKIFFQDRDPLFYRWCKSKFKALPRNMQPKFVINSFGQILQAVNEGMGVAVVPTHVLDRSFYRDKVLALGEDFDVQTFDFNFVYHSEFKDSLKIKQLYSMLKKGSEEISQILE